MKIKRGLLLLLVGFSFNFSAISTNVYADGAESDVGIFFSDIEEVPSKPNLSDLKPNSIPETANRGSMKLPQTGEKSELNQSIIGMGGVGIAIFLLNKKRSQNGGL